MKITLKRLVLFAVLLPFALVALRLVSLISLSVHKEDLYGTYQYKNEVVVLSKDGTYKYVLRYLDGTCISAEGDWEFSPEDDSVDFSSFVDAPGEEPRTHPMFFERPIVKFFRVGIVREDYKYALKVPPEAYVPCGEGPADRQ